MYGNNSAGVGVGGVLLSGNRMWDLTAGSSICLF